MIYWYARCKALHARRYAWNHWFSDWCWCCKAPPCGLSYNVAEVFSWWPYSALCCWWNFVFPFTCELQDAKNGRYFGFEELLPFLSLFLKTGKEMAFFWVDTYICLLSVTGSIGVEENGSIFPEWTSRRSWKDRQKTRKANANGQQHLLAASEPELIYYGKHSGLVGQCKSDVFCPSVDDEACTSGYDKVSLYNLIAY